MTVTEQPNTSLVPAQSTAALLKELDDVIKRANKEKPDPKAMRELRDAMDRHPQLWKILFDLGEHTTDALIEMTRGSGAVTESIRRGVVTMRDDMGYQSAMALERGLIEAVVQAWIVQQTTQSLYAKNITGSLTLKQADYWERKVTMTQRRYLRACETLARVRRLLTPAVQVNVARKQVNVAGSQINMSASPVSKEHGNAVDGTARERA